MNDHGKAKAALSEVLNSYGVYWTLTMLAEIVRERRDHKGRDLAEKVARNIEKARDA